MRTRLFLAAAALVCAAAPLSAQNLSITPFVGAMVPLNTMLIDTAGGAFYKTTAHTIYGLRISKELSPSFTLQLQGGMGKGGFEAFSGTTQIDLASSVWFADLRLRLRLVGSNATNLGVIGGAGWTQFKDGFFDTAHESDADTKLVGKFTGIFGFGAKAHLTGDASFTADLTDRIHAQPVEAPILGSGLIKPTQHDLTMSFGLNFPLGS